MTDFSAAHELLIGIEDGPLFDFTHDHEFLVIGTAGHHVVDEVDFCLVPFEGVQSQNESLGGSERDRLLSDENRKQVLKLIVAVVVEIQLKHK